MKIYKEIITKKDVIEIFKSELETLQESVKYNLSDLIYDNGKKPGEFNIFLNTRIKESDIIIIKKNEVEQNISYFKFIRIEHSHIVHEEYVFGLSDKEIKKLHNLTMKQWINRDIKLKT